MPLTDTAVRNLKPSEIPSKHTDAEGLYLYISPAGGKLWRMDYRFAGKRKTLSFGSYPTVSLKEARSRRDEVKTLLAKSIDPAELKKTLKAEALAIAQATALTFKVVADEWFGTKKDIYAASQIKKKQWLIDLLCSSLGSKQISQIVPADIVAAIRPVEAAGHNVTAHKMAETAGQICRFARTCGARELAWALDAVGKCVREFAALVDELEQDAARQINLREPQRSRGPRMK